MLSREHRLTRERDFAILFDEGRFIAGNLVNAKVWRVNPEKYPKRGYKPNDLKIGFVVSVKISKSAVERNRVKRQMREVVRLLLKEGGLKSGYHIAIIAKGNILGQGYGAIQESVHAVLQKAGVLL